MEEPGNDPSTTRQLLEEVKKKNLVNEVQDSGRVVADGESAGINRHVVGEAESLQERKLRIHPDPESCGWHREVPVEA
jgi:hypothetical protein